MWLAFSFVFGLIVGSFLTAFVDRLKAGRNFITARSSCDSCSKKLQFLDLIPLLSWLFLKGRCRHCQAKIGYAYFLIELISGLAFLAFYYWWPFDLQTWYLGLFSGYGLALIILLALAIYDWRWLILPNKLVYPLIVLSLFLVLGRWYLGEIVSWQSLAGSLLIASGIFYLIFLISPRYIGGGDVKLGFALGLLLANWQLSFLMVFMASLLASLVAGFFAKAQSAKIKSVKIAFGPFLIIATWICFWLGQDLIDWYLFWSI